MSDEMVRSLGPGRYLDWKGQFSISCRFRNEGDGAIWVFTGVYGPFSREDREGLWEELGAIRGLWEEPWCLGGDFNITLYIDDRNRTGRITSAMRGWWQGIEVSGRPSYRLATKLKGLKQNLKTWNKEVFGRLEKNKADALQQVESWDSVEEVRSLTEVELNQKKEAKESYEKWVSMEEVHWRQLSRELWLREGDRNTGFFHRMANAHRRINAMSKIMINGETVKEDLLGLFKEFHDQNSFIKSLNHTFLVLIPKKGGVEELGDYRPISLLGGLYKLLAKILDGSLIANEVIDLWQKRGEKGWMWYCISTVKYSVLVNGVPAGFFSSTKGLRQGDPLSPYLFIMGMEVLSVLITRAAEGGFIKGCRIWRDREQAVKVTHLLFADDTIIFCEAKKEALLHLGWVLFWFEAASGLKINLDKSMVIPVGEVDGVLDMAAEIGCRVGQLPTVYLGLPLEAPNRDVSAWDGVEERTRRRLSLWKRQYLSEGGRLTLIKSTLSSFPLYQMSVFRMPKSVARRIEKLQRDFLWGGTNGGTKSHLVKWEAVCVEKEKGGLGLRKITILNKALLGKWIWRFACAKEEFWKKVLEAKYGKRSLGGGQGRQTGAFGVEFGRRS
ncbi:putative ribonuclease H protein [Vitis vinifera]|uniref:Putative ribonuclease H protein n=1 Tax=Vitis vinifera TaxID=29760 RepID=A0A438FNI8_VITVI|nr:putative ribonuclease H protein [Vitis vinifera]